MKILNTNVDLIPAIINAIATVNAPREICVRVTDVRVSTINTANTESNVLYGII
jgi:hypothetical protein